MRRKFSQHFLWIPLLLLQLNDQTAAEAEPVISDIIQNRPLVDYRPRLSVAQQAQILSDVQQHQQRYELYDPRATSPSLVSFPGQRTTAYPSLARYKVNRNKQQQLQHLQQRVQQQQQQLNQQLNQGFLQTQQTQYSTINQPFNHQPNQNPQYQSGLSQQYNQYKPLPNNFQTPDPALYLDQQSLQIYYEKQRQLELLQRQREQLLLEQQELKRQQELLKQQLATTTPLPPLTTTYHPAISTTLSPVILSSPTARRITPAESELFLKAIATHQKKFTTTPRSTTTKSSRQERLQDDHPDFSKNILSFLQNSQESQIIQGGKSKPQIKIIYQTEKPSTTSKTSSSKSGKATLSQDALLKQLKIALAQANVDDVDRNVTTRDIVLPNGKRIQVIQAPNGLGSATASSNNVRTTTIKPAKAVLEELTKGVLPPGADFEVLRHKDDGKLEEVGKVPSLPAKKVTFVVLEEQPDGSYKVQGVKGNAEKDSENDVDSIVERIKKGELKLPPSSTNLSGNSLPTTFRPTTVRPTTTHTSSKSSGDIHYVTVSPNSVSSTDKYATSASTASGHLYNSLSTIESSHKSRNTFVPTVPIDNNAISTTPSYRDSSQGNSYINQQFSSSSLPRSISTTTSDNLFEHDFKKTTSGSTSLPSAVDSLSTLLRREGLFAMAKYLTQSGLDHVLNETGPYTIFVPTDKAFRTLLVQLGGPEKAEQKFRDNPRLLSGLLLHHVIPGAFRIDSLQDEMTGVSLAGTQLRVNVYAMHDHEWNDVTVTTINGARVAPNKRDVEIPQGIAHAVDRVMFPLPVGDLIQTLQADRERRFTTFLKLLQASGLETTLSGTKTFTVFAPTDAAFEEVATKNGGPIWTESDGAEAAKTIVSKHIIPTTMYTAGMRYYHQKETIKQNVPIHIHKNGGRIRINDARVVTYNVPATNGVLHAIDSVL